MSEELKENGFDSIDGLSNGDRSYLRDFNKVSVFDYCVLLNESGRGVYSQGDSVKPINLYSSQAYVDCLNSPDGRRSALFQTRSALRGRMWWHSPAARALSY